MDTNVTESPAPALHSRSHTALKILPALALVLAVVAMATAVGLFVTLDKATKELREEDAVLKLDLVHMDQRLGNLSRPEGQFGSF